MYNPFKEVYDDDSRDNDLIAHSLQGNSHALESLVLKHQSWIFNIALRMVCDPHAAQDITQDILIKVITRLSSYDSSKSAFRTWLYRIVANHIINVKKSEKEIIFTNMVKGGDFEDYITGVPDRRKSSRPELQIYSNEIKITCVQCILMRLNRKERMVFILGSIFNVNDSIGSEICEMTKVNFRKILSRSRKKVHDFFSTYCSLFDEKNPCRCNDHVDAMIKSNFIDPDNLIVNQQNYGKLGDVLSESIENLEEAYYEYHMLFGDQPFLKGPDMTIWLKDFISKHDMFGLLNIYDMH